VKDTEIIKLAADLHYNFVNIHPFGDGNGRTARLLMNYIQLYHNEPLIKIFTEDRTEYIDRLNETEEKENMEIFREFIGKQETKFLKAEIDKHKKLNKGFMLTF
jgi:Fic family protein